MYYAIRELNPEGPNSIITVYASLVAAKQHAEQLKTQNPDDYYYVEEEDYD